MTKQQKARYRRWKKRVHYFAQIFSRSIPLTHNCDGHYIGMSSSYRGHSYLAHRPDVMWS